MNYWLPKSWLLLPSHNLNHLPCTCIVSFIMPVILTSISRPCLYLSYANTPLITNSSFFICSAFQFILYSTAKRPFLKYPFLHVTSILKSLQQLCSTNSIEPRSCVCCKSSKRPWTNFASRNLCLYISWSLKCLPFYLLLQTILIFMLLFSIMHGII